jgi:hypothetical protein
MKKLLIITFIAVIVLTIVTMIPHDIKVDNKKEIIDFNLLEDIKIEEGYSKADIELLDNLRHAYHGTLCAPGETEYEFWSFKNPLYVSRIPTDLCKYPGEYGMYISKCVQPYNRAKNDIHFEDRFSNLTDQGPPQQQGYKVTTYNENFIEPFKTINQKLIDINKTDVYYQFVEEMTIFDKLKAAKAADNLVFVDTPTGTYLLYISYNSRLQPVDFLLNERKHLSTLAFNPPMLIIFVFMGFVAISLIVWTMIRIPKTKTRSNIFKKEQ